MNEDGTWKRCIQLEKSNKIQACVPVHELSTISWNTQIDRHPVKQHLLKCSLHNTHSRLLCSCTFTLIDLNVHCFSYTVTVLVYVYKKIKFKHN